MQESQEEPLTLGELLRLYRERAEIRQEVVAQFCSVPKRRVIEIEKGTGRPPDEKFIEMFIAGLKDQGYELSDQQCKLIQFKHKNTASPKRSRNTQSHFTPINLESASQPDEAEAGDVSTETEELPVSERPLQSWRLRFVLLLLAAIIVVVAFISVPVLFPHTSGSSPQQQPTSFPQQHKVVTQQTIAVPAQGGWVDTGINIQQGDTVRITASGKWTLDTADPNLGYADCKGYHFPSGAPRTEPWASIQTFPIGALIGLVGEEDEENKRIRIGCDIEFFSATSGPLRLKANDSSEVDDNAGTMQVQIVVER